MNWRDYWNGDSSIYVNDRHRRLHYKRVANDLLCLKEELFGDRRPEMLDYGCGEAIEADRIAKACARLVLAETAPRVVESLSDRFGNNADIEVVVADSLLPGDSHRFDLIVVNSVIQYVQLPALRAMLADWRKLLRPAGKLVVADVIPRGARAAVDAAALLRFGWKGGFFFAALGGLVRTALSDYRKLRGTLGIAQYDEAEFLDILRKAGYTATRRAHNLGHNPTRMCFVAEPSG